MFRLTSLATALLSLFMLSAPASAYEAITGPLGLLAYDKAKAYDGYTLFTPHTKVSSWIVDKIQDPGSRKTYLIDMEGNIGSMTIPPSMRNCFPTGTCSARRRSPAAP